MAYLKSLFYRVFKFPKQWKHMEIQTLTDMLSNTGLASSGNIMLKIDVEGAEWSVFGAATAEELKKFSQIVVEFHGIGTTHSYAHTPLPSQLEAMQKLLQDHTVVYTSGNNCCPDSQFGALQYGRYHIPALLEVTFVRNDLVQKLGQCVSVSNVTSTRPNLQKPNEVNSPDIRPPELPPN